MMITVFFPRTADVYPARWVIFARSMRIALICCLLGSGVCFARSNTDAEPGSAVCFDQDQKWVQPIALLEDLGRIEQFPLAAHWAASTRQVIKQLESCDSLADPDCQLTFDHLQSQLEELEFLVRQITSLPATDEEIAKHDELTAQLSHMRYAIQRRLVVWPLIHEVAKRQQERVAPLSTTEPNPIRTVASRKMVIDDLDPSWSEYLELDKAASAINSLNPDPAEQKQQSRRVLSKICSPVLSAEQRDYLSGVMDNELLEVLKDCAADPVHLQRLLTRIERVEYSNSAGNLYGLNDDYHNLLWSGVPELQELAGHLQAHYRNANFRLTVSEKFLNQIVPAVPDSQEPFRERILGAQVVGQNQISNEVFIRLIPDTEQIKLHLETQGRVFSRSRAHRSGFTIHNEGSSRFQVIKGLAVGRNGIVTGKPVSSSSTSQRLTGMNSELDSIPIIGWMARKIAKQKVQQQAPNTERITKQKIESMARLRVDEQVDHYLDLMRDQTYVNLLQPLIALELEPEPIETKTTEQDVVIRYRLAGRDQMAASTARPVPLDNNLLSMQVHETALNNLHQRIELAGKQFSIPELKSHLQDVFRLPPSEPTDLEARADAQFVFASFDPLRVDFEEGGLALTINLKSLRVGEKGKTWKQLTVKALYHPEVEGTRVVFRQTPDGISLRGKRLRLGDQIAIRTIFTALFDPQYEINAVPEKLAQSLGDTMVEVGQFVLNDGWIGVSWMDASDPEVVAETMQRRRNRTGKARR
ncbi:MAG: hypothetical protein VYE64_03365 [Planctomycetota bacterium]|nr:hypothetical protein [Planctomycetota bacterium]